MLTVITTADEDTNMVNFNLESPYLRGKQAAAYLGLGVSTFYRRIQEGALPKGIAQSRKCVVWRRVDLDAYIARCETSMIGGEN